MLDDPFGDKPELVGLKRAPRWLRRLSMAAVVVLLVLLLVMLTSGKAKAAEVFKAQNDKGPVALRLSEAPCTDAKVRAHLYAQVLDDRRFKAAVLTWEGRDWKSCWIEINGLVRSIDEEGSPFQPVPRSAFRDDSI